MESKELGKISAVRFGFGGYQDVQFGVAFELGGEGWGVNDFWGMWATRSDNCKWTEQDRDAAWGEMLRRLVKLMLKAKITDVAKLRGVPVEVTFKDRALVSWRALTEVL
jgi:hypothetical protein